MGFRKRIVLLAAAGLLQTWGPVSAQEGVSRYEVLYGQPVDVSLSDLTQSAVSYDGRAVRTRGRLELAPDIRRIYILRDLFGGAVLLEPMSDLAGIWADEAPRLIGRELQITGVFRTNAAGAGAGVPVGLIQFWQFVDEDAGDDGKEIKSAEATLEALVTQPGKRDGQTVRVVGKFRGSNLYGDLPSASRRSSSDWVIKDDAFAVWITGKKPKGSGFNLDAGLKRDTGKWLEVVGRPDTRRGVTYIHAQRVTLTSPPTPTARVEPAPPPPPRPKVPPVVVFSLPLDGEHEVPRDSRFVVQFSKDMDEQSFKGRVYLRYVGPRRPGDRAFDATRLSYDWGRRALTVDPGDVLRPGRQIELVLLPGIADTDGLDLVSRPGRESDAVTDVLRYEIGL